MLDKKIKDEILHCLPKEKLHKIILFGSHAYGTSHKDSDIDLLIISDNKGMSETYRDHLKNKNTISQYLIGIRKKYPIDLIVYTKDEWEFLKATKISFIKTIEDKGIDLL